MAIYDPIDGSIDPRPRCTGNCCRCFSLEYPYETVLEENKEISVNSQYHSFIPNVETIASMLIPLGIARGQEIFTCKHLGKNGDCGIYEIRPQMCRDFPGPNSCSYRNCASHGKQNIFKRLLNWFRD